MKHVYTCMCLWVDGSEWMASASQTGVQCCLANLPHVARSYLTARPPCCMWILTQFIISGKWNYLCIYSFVWYLSVVASRVSALTVAVQLRELHFTLFVFCMLLVNLKETFRQTLQKFSHYLLALTPVGSRVKFSSPQNISGASRQNRVSAFCWSTEIDGDLF